ncbi:MAG: peptidoglycan-binding protein [Bdellovibrionales bacterium]|nr:peptidoglycan-binding protein [Bdellovibrionales bacterium]
METRAIGKKSKWYLVIAILGAGAMASANSNYSHTNDMADRTTKMIKTDTIRSTQAALKDEGYNVKVDGILGPNTRTAIRQFQTDRELSVTGNINSETLSALAIDSSGYRMPASVEEDAVDGQGKKFYPSTDR